jgi:hypothetical protein
MLFPEVTGQWCNKEALLAHKRGGHSTSERSLTSSSPCYQPNDQTDHSKDDEDAYPDTRFKDPADDLATGKEKEQSDKAQTCV